MVMEGFWVSDKFQIIAVSRILILFYSHAIIGDKLENVRSIEME
jgi:hypothetical protein